MKFKIITLFPDFFREALNFSLLKKAQEKSIIEVEIIDLRDFAKNNNTFRQVDDRPYGGGPGMLLMVEPLYKAIQYAKSTCVNPHVMIFAPKGKKYNQIMAEEYAKSAQDLILIAPHYEGFDERVLNYVDSEISIGDFVLTGGEFPTLLVIDSITRLIPGVVGNEESIQSESFSKLKEGISHVEHPQYTRPETFIDEAGNAHRVPEVLTNGNHKEIKKWKEQNSRIEQSSSPKN